VRVGLASEDGYPHQGEMVFVDNRLDPATGTIFARALLDNTDRIFTPGLFARVQLLGSGKREALLINDRAVLTDQDRKYVYLVGADGKTVRKDVTLGPLIDGLRVVDSGLAEGDVVVVNGTRKIFSPGQPVKLLTQLIVREDAHILYGFASAAERDLFRLLINSVSGIGPKTALNILSGISVTAFRGAVASSDVKSLSQISGVGKKTAERIVVELRDKIGAAGAWEAASAKHALSPDDQKINDAVLALMALGFKQIEAHDSIRAAQAVLGEQATVEELVRASLKKGT